MKNSHLSDASRTPFIGPGAPGDTPRVRVFRTRNTDSSNSWSTDRNLCRKSGLGSKSVHEKLIGLLKKIKASTETSVETNVETHVETSVETSVET